MTKRVETERKTLAAKAEVLIELYRRKNSSPSLVVTSPELQSAIKEVRPDLGVGNPANFLKDIIRRRNANDYWPSELKAQRITARQRFGRKRVLEFIDYLPDSDEPFPDRFDPQETTPIFPIQSVSLPSAARRLGREDETWLAQIMVNLRVVESQLAFRSRLSNRLKDIAHLQIGMKTQPEIDATFVATAEPEDLRTGGAEEHIFVTCEVKKKDERLLEDQIRFQVHQGFKTTASLKNPNIEAVLPIAIRVVAFPTDRGIERLIHIVEFETIKRDEYNASWRPIPPVKATGTLVDDTPVYGMPLVKASDALFRVMPAVKGIS